METPKTPLVVALRAVVLVGAALFVSAAIAGVAHYKKGVRDKANAARNEQFREAEAIQEQQSREVQVKEREAQKQEEQEQEARRLQMEAATIQLEREKGLCGRSGCVTITVLQAQQVSITHTDGNGYRHTHLGPNFSWPERIFEHQFHSKSNAASIEGMTAADFVGDLVRESSVITFAREPNYCGGEQDSDAIFELMNRYMFKSLASAV